MKTLYFFFAFQTVKPEKSDAMIKTDFTPKKDRQQARDVVLLSFMAPNHQLQLFAPRGLRLE
jgi:hypothetical protein